MSSSVNEILCKSHTSAKHLKLKALFTPMPNSGTYAFSLGGVLVSLGVMKSGNYLHQRTHMAIQGENGHEATGRGPPDHLYFIVF